MSINPQQSNKTPGRKQATPSTHLHEVHVLVAVRLDGHEQRQLGLGLLGEGAQQLAVLLDVAEGLLVQEVGLARPLDRAHHDVPHGNGHEVLAAVARLLELLQEADHLQRYE